MDERPSLLHIIPSNKWGGVQTYAYDICRHYHDRGWNVAALTRNAVNIDSRFSETGIRLLHAPVGGFFDINSILTLARELKKTPQGKSTVHVHRYRDAFTALLAKRIARRPDIRIVSTRHNVRHGRNTFFFRKMYNLVDAHIFVSRLAHDRFINGLSHIALPAGRSFILHNSLNIDSDRKPAPQQGPVVAMFLGPVVAGKGIETLIDAMVKLRDLRMRFRICGSGNPDFIDSLRRRAISRGVMECIDWNLRPAGTGAGSSAEECHIGVVPSVEMEACGMANIRFMAAGRPQVTTGIGAQTEYLEDGSTALFVPPADAGALADAIRRLASDQALRERMGRQALKDYSERLSWKHFTDELDKIYNIDSISLSGNRQRK